MLASVVSFHFRKLLVQNHAFIVDGGLFFCKQPSAIPPAPFVLTCGANGFRSSPCSFFRWCSFPSHLSCPPKCVGERGVRPATSLRKTIQLTLLFSMASSSQS